MKPVINLFRISIHPEQREDFLGCLADLAQASKELGEDLFFCYLQIIDVHLNLLLILQNLVYLIKRTCCVCKLQHLVGQMD